MTSNQQRQQAPRLGIPVVWSEECLQPEPGGEVWLGVREPGTELPDRASVILARWGTPERTGWPARPLSHVSAASGGGWH